MRHDLGSLDAKVRGAQRWDVIWFRAPTRAVDYAPGDRLVAIEGPAHAAGRRPEVVSFQRTRGGPWLVLSVEPDLGGHYSWVTVRRLH